MSIEMCRKCGVIGVGAMSEIGVPVPCYCLPEGKTCKDCKFEAQCLIEGVIEGPETICQMPHERMFAEPGQKSYRELWAEHNEEQAKKAEEERRREAQKLIEKEQAHQRALAGKVWTELMILEGILPHNLCKVHTELPPGVEPDNQVDWYFQTYLDQHEDPIEAARHYLNVHAPGWRKMIGTYLPKHLRGVFKCESGNREVSDRLERTKCAAPSLL